MKIVCVAYLRNKLALRTRLRNLNLRSQFSMFYISYLRFFEVCGRFVGVKVGVANFWGQPIGIDENNSF